MSNRYEIEVLLRPAVELNGVLVCGSSALLLAFAPQLVLMPKAVAWGAASVMAIWAVRDAVSVYRVWRYRAGMKALPPFTVANDEFPFKEGKLYIGNGFEWGQKHTQRLIDTNDSRYRDYVVKRDVVDWLFSRFRGKPAELGGNPLLHGVEPLEAPVYIDDRARKNQTIIKGVPGSGKTVLMRGLCVQDIRRSPNSAVIIFDPKGDADLLRGLYIEAKAMGRENDLTVCLLGNPEASARYNPVGHFSRLTEVATRLANQLPSEGSAAAFKDFAWRFINIVAKALYSFEERMNLDILKGHLNNVDQLFIRVVDQAIAKGDANRWRKVLLEIDAETPEELPREHASRLRECYLRFKLIERFGQELDSSVARDLSVAIRFEKAHWDKLVSAIDPLLEKLTTGMASELVSPDYFDLNDPRPMFTWEQILRRKGILYVGLDALSDMTVSSAWGSSMLADLVSVAGSIYKQSLDAGTPGNETPSPIYVHADEINELVGPEFVQLVNKCRGAGIYVTAYTQTTADLQVGLGDEARADQLMGNFGNKILYRVPSKKTASVLTDTLPTVRIKTVMAVSGVSDSANMLGDSHFDSRNEDRISTEAVPMLSPSDPQQLPIGHSFAQMDGGRVFKLRMPLIVDTDEASKIPSDIQGLIETLQKRMNSGSPIQKESPWWAGSAGHG